MLVLVEMKVEKRAQFMRNFSRHIAGEGAASWSCDSPCRSITKAAITWLHSGLAASSAGFSSLSCAAKAYAAENEDVPVRT